MSTTPARDKASAVLWLAAGETKRAAAEAAGVSPNTITEWLRNPVFASEVEKARTLYGERPQDARALLDHLDGVAARLAPKGAPTVDVEGVRVRVSVPPGASPRKRERLIGQAIARGLRARWEAES
ncbi:helix-turn-helix domain-containing protein [Streptomyces sp. IBSBF 2806]|uniref:helix-turn-helix domain-containing protein n=1 Tax=Streptomyces sp. IBSBF 2806 TaxID=2903529 RepID=UPI002FDC4B2B